MSRKSSMRFFAFGILLFILGVISTVLGAIAWSWSITFSLPLPLSLPAITTFLPLITALIAIFSNWTRSTERHRPSSLRLFLQRISLQLLNLLPGVLGTLALACLFPGEILSCRLERQWQSFFHNKNADAIRQIQDRLRCCGLRSIHDRAWPFKDANHGDNACEVQFGYARSCLERWMGVDRSAGMMVFMAAVFTLIVRIALEYGYTGPSWMMAHRGEDTAAGVNDTNARFIGYTDNPEVREAEEDGDHNENDERAQWAQSR